MDERNEIIAENEERIVMPTRRDVIRMGLFGGAAGALTLVLGDNIFAQKMDKNKKMKSDPKKDIAIVNMAIQLEQKAVNTYQAAADNNLLPTKAFRDVALQFAADHTAHRNKLMDAVSTALKGKPAGISDLGTFPIPQNVLKGKEHDVIRYALTLEMIASKTYLDAINNQLTTDEARDLAATIMPVETQHAAIFRAVLMVVLKERGLEGDTKLVPYAFLDEQPTPPVPTA